MTSEINLFSLQRHVQPAGHVKHRSWCSHTGSPCHPTHLITYTSYNRHCFVCFSWYETSTFNWTVATEREFLLLCHVCVTVYFTIQSCSSTLCCVDQCCYPGTASQVQYPLRAMWLSHESYLIYILNEMCSKCFKFQGAHLGVQDNVICQGCVKK
jgi:hypothetical protein